MLEGAVNDKGKLTNASAAARLKAIRDESDNEDEREALQRYVALVGVESKTSRAVKRAQSDLDAEVLARYATLSEQRDQEPRR